MFLQGFAQLLSSGANYFSADDHEFWNNAPNFVAFARNTWSEAGRREWWEAAGGLYRAFQAPRALVRFDVPPVSFLSVDTRVHRDGDRGKFMKQETEDDVAAWVAGLNGPGVMVVGQPILQTERGWIKAHFYGLESAGLPTVRQSGTYPREKSAKHRHTYGRRAFRTRCPRPPCLGQGVH